MNPILPLRAELPLRYLQGLKAYAKQRRRKAEDGRDGLGIDQADTWDIWIGDLIKQYREGTKVEDSPNRSSNRSSSLAPADRKSKEDVVKVHPPHLTSTGGPATGSHKALLRQGPVIFTPAPQEADEDEETYASDIAILKVSAQDGDDEEDTAREEVRVMSIAWSSSRVDIGLYTEVSEPVWVDNDVSVVDCVSMMLTDRFHSRQTHRYRSWSRFTSLTLLPMSLWWLPPSSSTPCTPTRSMSDILKACPASTLAHY